MITIEDFYFFWSNPSFFPFSFYVTNIRLRYGTEESEEWDCENDYPTKPQPEPSSTTFLPWRSSSPESTACSRNFPNTTPLSHITDPVTPGLPWSYFNLENWMHSSNKRERREESTNEEGDWKMEREWPQASRWRERDDWETKALCWEYVGCWVHHSISVSSAADSDPSATTLTIPPYPPIFVFASSAAIFQGLWFPTATTGLAIMPRLRVWNERRVLG